MFFCRIRLWSRAPGGGRSTPGALSAAAGFTPIPAGAGAKDTLIQLSWTVFLRPHKSKKIEAIASLLQLRVHRWRSGILTLDPIA